METFYQMVEGKREERQSESKRERERGRGRNATVRCSCLSKAFLKSEFSNTICEMEKYPKIFFVGGCIGKRAEQEIKKGREKNCLQDIQIADNFVRGRVRKRDIKKQRQRDRERKKRDRDDVC